MKELRLAGSIITMMIKDRVQYPVRLLVDTFGIASRCGVLLILYWYVFRFQGGLIHAVTFPVAAWSMFLYFSFMTLRLRDVAKLIMRDIQTGTIEILLAKPVQYLTYRMWWQLGSGLYPFMITTGLGIILLTFAVGIPESMQSWFFVGTLVVVGICAIVLSLLIYSVVGLLAFWIEDVNPVFWVVDKAVMILGGSYLPVALFPAFMYKIAIWSPFGASQFITHTVYDTWKFDYIHLMTIQVLWIILFGAIVVYMFSRAYKKVSVNGG